MTEGNKRRRDLLAQVEGVVHATLAMQPADDADGCGQVLDAGIGRIYAMVRTWLEDTAHPVG